MPYAIALKAADGEPVAADLLVAVPVVDRWGRKTRAMSNAVKEEARKEGLRDGENASLVTRLHLQPPKIC